MTDVQNVVLLLAGSLTPQSINNYLYCLHIHKKYFAFLCLDSVSGASERASRLQKLSVEMTVQLSVWSEVNNLHMVHLIPLPLHRLLIH